MKTIINTIINFFRPEGLKISRYLSCSQFGKILILAVIFVFFNVLAAIAVVKMSRDLAKKPIGGIVGGLILCVTFLLIMSPTLFAWKHLSGLYSNAQGSTTVIQEFETGWSDSGEIKIKYDIDGDGKSDFTEWYTYSNLVPWKTYTVKCTITATEYDECRTYAELFDGEFDEAETPIAMCSWSNTRQDH